MQNYERTKLKWLALCLAVLLTACGGGGDDDSTDSTTTPPPTTTTPTFSLTGTITVADNTAVDGDNNNDTRNAPFRRNDSFSTAQRIPNPVILGGYVNQPGQGPTGRTQASGDLFDYFLVDLSAGQTITLFIGSDDPAANDLDLFLFNANNAIVDASANTGAVESLRVPNSGRFAVRVSVRTGASNYVLSIGQNISSFSASGHMKLSSDFVPGDVTVNLKQTGILSQQSKGNVAQTLGMKAFGGEPSRRMLMKLDADTPRLQQMQIDDQLHFASEEMRLKYQTLLAVKDVMRRADVAAASPNYILKASRVPNDRDYRFQWHHPFINLPQAWDITTGDPGVIVAVIDTGVLLDHPDLQGKLVRGFDFISDSGVALDGNGIDNNPNDPGDQSSSGSSFHGTHVAGIVAAATDNGSSVAGAGWDTRVMPLRVLGRGGSGSDFDIEQALRYAAGLSNDSGTVPTQRADIINMSLGGTSISSTFQGVVNQVRNSGVIIVAASGNDGGNITHFPASLNGVVSVSAVNISRQRAFYSNFNRHVDVAAPGGDNGDLNGDGVIDGVVSTLGDDRQGSTRFIVAPSFGTSMATPHVAGVLALMKAVNPNLSPSDVDNLLINGEMTADIGSRGRDDQFGYGLIDAHKSVLAALDLSGGAPAPAVPAQLSVSPDGLNFGANVNELVITTGNAGGGTLQLDRITEDSGGFVNVQRNEVDSNGLGTYIVSVQRNRAPGTYSANIGFESSANNVTLPIIWQVAESGTSTSGDAGRLFILLVDPADPSGLPFQQAIVDANNGNYSFRFDGVEAGRYLVVAGSDNNNDTQICDPGDSCGAFLTVDRPRQLNVSNAGFSGIDFSVNFNTNFLTSSAIGSNALGGRPVYRRLPEIKQFAR